MTKGITHNLDEVRRAIGKLAANITAPKELFAQIGLIVAQGFEDQIETQGKHWGSPWPESGKVINQIRAWQGYSGYKPLRASGTLMRSFHAITTASGVTIGTTQRYAARLHRGEGSPEMQTFRKISGPGEWHHTFRRIKRYPLLPTSTLAKSEHDAIYIAINKGLKKMMRGAT